MRATKEGRTPYLLRDIPNDLWERVKEAAKVMGVSARVWVLQAMREELKRQVPAKKMVRMRQPTSED